MVSVHSPATRQQHSCRQNDKAIGTNRFSDAWYARASLPERKYLRTEAIRDWALAPRHERLEL